MLDEQGFRWWSFHAVLFLGARCQSGVRTTEQRDHWHSAAVGGRPKRRKRTARPTMRDSLQRRRKLPLWQQRSRQNWPGRVTSQLRWGASRMTWRHAEVPGRWPGVAAASHRRGEERQESRIGEGAPCESRTSRKTHALITSVNPGMWLVACIRDILGQVVMWFIWCSVHVVAHVVVLCSSSPVTCHESGAERCGADRGRPCAADPGRCAACATGARAVSRRGADRGCASATDPGGNRGACCWWGRLQRSYRRQATARVDDQGDSAGAASVNASFYFWTPAFDRCFWRVGEGYGSLAKIQATARVDVPTTLSVSLQSIVVLERGPYSCLAVLRMKVKHIHTCHSHCISEARARANGDKCARWMETPLWSSVLSFERCYCRQVECVKPKRAYHQPSRELRSWVVDYALLNKEGREPRDLAMCSFPFCEGSAAVLMQPTFDRGRATWHDAQIRHTMDPPSKQDGLGALHRHDIDGRDHDRHHHGWREPCNEEYRTCQNTKISLF